MTTQHSSRPTALGALARGLLAGVAGTAATDTVWYLRHRAGGGHQDPFRYEFSIRSVEKWDQASAPGQVGKRLVEGLFQSELPDERAGLVSDVVHWAYGTGWAGLYGLLAGSLRHPRARLGVLFGPAVWLSSYTILPAAELYRPIWEYRAKALWKDASAHLAYGVATAGVCRFLDRR